MIYQAFSDYVLKIKSRHPRFRLKIKEDSKLHWFIYRASLMRFWCPDYMTNVTTTIGYTVWMPKRFIGTRTGYKIMVHENVHIEDYHQWKLLFQLSYLFLLPTVVTFRAYWEWRAYKATLRVNAEVHGDIDQELMDSICRKFTGPMYLWMFPFKKMMMSLIEAERAKIISELHKESSPT